MLLGVYNESGNTPARLQKKKKSQEQTELLTPGIHTTATATTLPRPPEMLLPAPAARSAIWHCGTAASCHGTFKAAQEKAALSVRTNKG